MPTVVKRSVQIKITLSADLHARLHDLARQLGQAPATLCSTWVGEKVRHFEVQAGVITSTQDKMLEQLMPLLREEAGQQLRLADALTDDLKAKQDAWPEGLGKPRKAPAKAKKR